MVKVVFLVKRGEDMDSQTYRDYILNKHAPLFKKVPGVKKYIQHFVTQDVLGDTADFDGIVEVWFDSVEVMQSALQSPEAEASQPDNPDFNVIGLVTEEVEIDV